MLHVGMLTRPRNGEKKTDSFGHRPCDLLPSLDVCLFIFIPMLIFFLITIHLNIDLYAIFMRPSRDGPYYVIGYGGRGQGVHTGFRTITLVLYI